MVAYAVMAYVTSFIQVQSVWRQHSEGEDYRKTTQHQKTSCRELTSLLAVSLLGDVYLLVVKNIVRVSIQVMLIMRLEGQIIASCSVHTHKHTCTRLWILHVLAVAGC